jgi:hypothetical protein
MDDCFARRDVVQRASALATNRIYATAVLAAFE